MTAAPPESLTLDRVQTPIGTALVVTDEAGVLRAFNWTDYEDQMSTWISKRYASAARREGRGPIRNALEAYFSGEIRALEGVRWHGEGTAFQRRVWETLCEIPAGETISYRTLAERIGRPTAMRAVGLANGSNPVAVIVPCHRVIGANGALTGYGGGLPRKRWLLEHEGAHFRDQAAA
jgi:methylated-DNA-[protein]-cysteine S-methyltransferase